jgi:hypothetical protein
MASNTDKYEFRKPAVGGDENEWGGMLNSNFDKLDKLLGPDEGEVIDGIIIENGQIDGGSITGELGKDKVDLEEDEDPLEINDSVIISGDVKHLKGMDDPDGKITNCDVTTRELIVTESITEQVKRQNPSDVIAFKAKDGTMHYLGTLNDEQEIKLTMSSGQSMTLMLNWGNADRPPTSMTWDNNIKWLGGGSPDIVEGVNVIQVWCVNTGTTDQIFGAGAGAAT